MSSECEHSLEQSLYWGQPTRPHCGGRFLRFYGPAAGHWLIVPVFQLCLCALPWRKGSGMPTQMRVAGVALAPGVMPGHRARRTAEKPETHLGFKGWKKEISVKTNPFPSWEKGPWGLSCWVRGKKPTMMSLDKIFRMKVSPHIHVALSAQRGPSGCSQGRRREQSERGGGG